MDVTNWLWLNESDVKVEGDKITIYAPEKTDWFNNPIPDDKGQISAPVYNAPILYTEVEGDFTFSVKVTPNHIVDYDACAIMCVKDEYMWTKVAFEKTDFGTKAAVCVVTNEISDDANGCNIEGDSVWLKICRVGDIFSSHYSLDGVTYNMVRLFNLPAGKSIKVGLEAQSPIGEGGDRVFEEVKLEKVTVGNLRAGI